MSIRVEFYGVARMRSGTDSFSIDLAGRDTLSLGEVLQALATEFPDLADECIVGDRLQTSYAANIDGDTFVTDPTSAIRGGQSLLILSADAGG